MDGWRRREKFHIPFLEGAKAHLSIQRNIKLTKGHVAISTPNIFNFGTFSPSWFWTQNNVLYMDKISIIQIKEGWHFSIFIVWEQQKMV